MALVLVVEDESLLRHTLSRRLEKIGHSVHQAENLAEATEHIALHRPDLVLLDLSLPDGHGLDFYERNAGALEETVVLVMTAVGEVEDAVRAMKLGALDFLAKPIAHDELVTSLREQQKAKIVNCFAWREGVFAFETEDTASSGARRFASLVEIIFEGLRRFGDRDQMAPIPIIE